MEKSKYNLNLCDEEMDLIRKSLYHDMWNAEKNKATAEKCGADSDYYEKERKKYENLILKIFNNEERKTNEKS